MRRVAVAEGLGYVAAGKSSPHWRPKRHPSLDNGISGETWDQTEEIPGEEFDSVEKNAFMTVLANGTLNISKPILHCTTHDNRASQRKITALSKQVLIGWLY